MIITSSDPAANNEVKHHHFDAFEIDELGPHQYFICTEVASSPKGSLLSQTKYVTDMLSSLMTKLLKLLLSYTLSSLFKMGFLLMILLLIASYLIVS